MSGLGLAEQARRLMHSDPPKREEEFAESVETWLDKVRKLEVHGEEYKLAPADKINALRMLMTGKAVSTCRRPTGTTQMRPRPTRTC